MVGEQAAGEPERLHELARRQVPQRQPVDDPEPGRFGERRVHGGPSGQIDVHDETIYLNEN